MNTNSLIVKIKSLLFFLTLTTIFATTTGIAADHSNYEELSLHVIWVNKSATKTPLFCEDTVQLTYILNKVQSWREKNPKTPIYFWFDSTLIKDDAVSTMKSTLAQETYEGISFVDIRELDLVKQHPWAFSSAVSFYPRMDALRFAIARDFLRNAEAPRYFIYTDIESNDVDLPKLIASSIEDLNQDGIVMANADEFKHDVTDYALPFENGFMIIDKKKDTLLNAIEDIFLASYFQFTSKDENLAFLEPEAIYKVLGSFLQAHCNRDVKIAIGDWCLSFQALDFDQVRWGIDLEVWTRNFFFSGSCLFSLPKDFTSFPRAIPTVKEKILRPSQFTKVEISHLLPAKTYAQFILQLPELDAIAFLKRFEFEDVYNIITQSDLQEKDILRIVTLFKRDAY